MFIRDDLPKHRRNTKARYQDFFQTKGLTSLMVSKKCSKPSERLMLLTSLFWFLLLLSLRLKTLNWKEVRDGSESKNRELTRAVGTQSWRAAPSQVFSPTGRRASFGGSVFYLNRTGMMNWLWTLLNEIKKKLGFATYL